MLADLDINAYDSCTIVTVISIKEIANSN